MSRPLYEAKAEFFRTLGHPVRIRVLELLSERPHAVYELLAEIESEPSSLSHQLAVLRRTGSSTNNGAAETSSTPSRPPRSATSCARLALSSST